jgi:hypothetical protein
MKKIDKKILSQLNLYADSWTQIEHPENKVIYSSTYNANKIFVCPFYKPISKIFNLNGK